jgi:S-layer protein
LEIDPDITTLNIDSSTAASDFVTLTAPGVKTINVAGDAILAVTAGGSTLTALTGITVTNTAGFQLASAIGTGASFTGGAGDDEVAIGATTKAILMNDGDDVVVTSTGTVGTGGSVDGGNGFDTISMSGANAATVSASGTFNTKFTNFEQLEVTAAGANTINLVGINAVNSVVTGGATGALTLNNYATNGTLILEASVGGGGSYVANVANAAFNPSDIFNVVLFDDAALTAGSVTVADVETINISAPDASADGSAAVINTLTLVATSATSVNVSGNNGLTLTNTGNAAITSFDASGVVADGTADTAANLRVTFASENTTAADTVSITGGEGDDVLTGNAAKDVIFGREGNDALDGGTGNDTIDGGADNDTITGGTGADVLTGGAGDDVFVYDAVADSAASVAANTAVTFDTITDFTSGDDSIDVDALNGTAFIAGAGTATGTTVTTLTTEAGSLGTTFINTFADLSAAAAGLLTASAAGAAGAATGLQTYVIDLSGNTGALGTGIYLVVNDADTDLTAGDVMIAWTGTSEAPVATDFIL